MGSGASATFGLPTMNDLAIEICNHRDNFSDDEEICEFFTNIKQGIGLETALGIDSQMSQTDKDLIRKIVWDTINSADRRFFNNLLQCQSKDLSLVSLLKKLLEPTPHIIDIITTNYDRLVEYASDIAKANIITGYEGTYFKTMEPPCSKFYAKTMRARIRTVNLWKVHGSLDWFLDPYGELCSLPVVENIPEHFSPCIVPPGHDKYQITHFNPYRFTMAQADKAIQKAKSYLVFGYGFNDDHIQPKILEEIKKNKPIVVVTKNATTSCKNLIQQTSNTKYMIIEEQDKKTHVITDNSDDLYDEQFWTMQDFIDKW